MLQTEQLKSYLEAQLPATLDLLRQMVNINSFTTNREGVARLARYTAECFAPLGFTAEYPASAYPAYANHLVLTRPGKTKRSIALISHLDTVFPPEEEERNNFHWQPDGDRLYGPGTQDIKGGTTQMWLVLQALRQHAPEVFEDITWKLLWNSSEECYSPDFGDVCRAHFTPDTIAALVFEAEGGNGAEHYLVACRKGRATWKVHVSGRAAHAGGKHKQGANAIVQAGEIVQRLAAATDYAKNLTFNVGMISGGTVANRVPHEAVVAGEFRAFTTEAYNHGLSVLKSLEGPGSVKSVMEGYACQIKVEIMTEVRPWPRNPGTDRLLQIWKETGDKLGLPTGQEERGGLSDGNHIWDAVPTMDGLGSWGDNDHCSERSADGSKVPEYLKLSRIVPKALLNVMAIHRLATAKF